jgi:hypothetical protein
MEQLKEIYGPGPWDVWVAIRDRNGTLRMVWKGAVFTALDQNVTFNFNVERDTEIPWP